MKELEQEEADRMEASKYSDNMIELTEDECLEYEQLMSNDDLFF